MTLCGLPLAESANWSVAVRVPGAVGLKLIGILQLAPVGRVAHADCVMVKSPGLAEAGSMVTELKFTVAVPAFKTDTPLPVPTPTLMGEKTRAGGLNVKV